MVLKFGDKILKNTRVKEKSTYLTDNPRILRLVFEQIQLKPTCSQLQRQDSLEFMFYDLVSI